VAWLVSFKKWGIGEIVKPSELLVLAVLLLGAFGVLYIIQSNKLTGAVFSDFSASSNEKTFEKKFKYEWDSKKDDADSGIFDGKKFITVAQGASLGKSFEIGVDAILSPDSSGILVSQVDYLNGIRIELSVTNNGNFKFFIGDADNSFAVQTVDSYRDGELHTVEASLDEGVAKIVVDKKTEILVSAPLAKVDSGVDITIGTNAGYVPWMQRTYQNFKGTIKHVSVRAPKNVA